MKELLSYPVLQVRRNKVIEYQRTEWSNFAKSEEQLELINNTKSAYSGEITEGGKKRMKRCLLLWSEALDLYNDNYKYVAHGNERKLVFLTLTLSAVQVHSDQEIKSKILRPFMRWLRESQGCNNYIWKAEVQKNGNIHFHIIIDQFVPKDEIRIKWNECQDNLRYHERYRYKFGDKEAPSTQIEIVQSQDQIEKYIGKYISKSQGCRAIEGRVWEASRNIKSLRYFEIERDTTTEKNMQVAVMKKEISFEILENCNIYNIKVQQVESILSTASLGFYEVYKRSLALFLTTSQELSDFLLFYDFQLFKAGLRSDSSYESTVERLEIRKEVWNQLSMFPEPFYKEFIFKPNH
jgi:hypothetical protein